MKSVTTLAAAGLIAATLSACGSTSTPTADTTSVRSPKSTHTSAASPSPHAASKTPSSSSGGKVTTLDPCQLVTRAEAAALTQATFGPGREEAAGIGKQCVYGAQTPNVLRVIVLEGSSTQDSQAEWDQLLAEAKQGAGQAANLVTLTPQSGLADRAEWVELNLSAIHVDGRGLAFLSGAVGVYVVDLVRDGTAPSRAALTAEAQTVVGRLP
jgi:hypothetical protein